MIPEVPFYMDGPGGLIDYVHKRIRENGHMVIVVAEGAGQELMAESAPEVQRNMDASGNKLLLDVGLWLCSTLKVIFLVSIFTLSILRGTFMNRVALVIIRMSQARA